MTPPVSQCRRALLQHRFVPSGQHDALWITDGLLASAFERYCRVSRTWNRRASNIPGPLESHRRLGRRRMGDASTWHCPPTPPPWAFLVPPDLTQWTWHPPSLPSARQATQERHDAEAQSPRQSLLSLVSQWLQEPNGQVAPELLDQTPPPPAIAQPATHEVVLGQFRWAAAHGDNAAVVSHGHGMCETLRQSIVVGEVLPHDLSRIASEIWETLESRLHGSPDGHRLSLSVCEAVLDGLTSSKVFSATLMDTPFWNSMLAQMAKLPADDGLCDAFVRSLKVMPTNHRPHVSGSIVAVLSRFFSEWNCSPVALQSRHTKWLLNRVFLDNSHSNRRQLETLPACSQQATRIAAIPSYLRQAKKISATLALTCETPDEAKALFQAVHCLALEEAASRQAGGSALRYCWLHMLARHPHVNQDFFFDATKSFSNPSLRLPPLSIVELSSLLLTQWASRGYLRVPMRVYHLYRHYLRKHDDAALTSLFLAIFSRRSGEEKYSLYCSAWKLLAKLGRTQDALRSLQVFYSSRGPLCVRMLEDLAMASKDHHMAIQLHDMWVNIKKTEEREWHPVVFDRYAKAIVHDPDIPPSTIWRVLDIGKIEYKFEINTDDSSAEPPRRVRYSLRRHSGHYGEWRAAVVEKAVWAFITAPHLSPRAALRHVSRAFTFLHHVRGQPSDALLRELYRMVTRDLRESRPGRTQRLLWFLKLVERRFGAQVAMQCRLLLHEWRTRLERVKKNKAIAARLMK
jgi:hypothetical protein